MQYRTVLIMTALAALTAAPAWTADTYAADGAHSYVGFSVSHMVISKVKGHFGEFTGTLLFDAKDPTKSSIQGTITVQSIDTGNDQRDTHLRSADFFDTEKFPEITFASKKVEKRGEGYAVLGVLTIKGVSKAVEIPFKVLGPAKDPWGNERVGVDLAPFAINRQDFGVTWNKTLETGGLLVGNEVTIELAGEFVKEAPKEAPKK